MEDQEQDKKIYNILKQENVNFTIFKEIDTIHFDVKNSSQKLICKIARNACQYFDTSIILDLGKNHSNNIIRRITNAMRFVTINSPSIVIRIEKNNNKHEDCFLDYIKIVNCYNRKSFVIKFQPQYNIMFEIKRIEVRFLSNEQMRLFLDSTMIEIDYELSSSKSNQNGHQKRSIVDKKTKLPILQSLNATFIAGLPLYGVSEENIRLQLDKTVQFIKIDGFSFGESIEQGNVFLSDLKKFILQNNETEFQQLEFHCEETKSEEADLYYKLVQICQQSNNIRKLTFQSKEEQFTYDKQMKSLKNQIFHSQQTHKYQFMPQFKIDLNIEILQLSFQLGSDNKSDLSEYLLRYSQLKFISRIDIDIVYQMEWKQHKMFMSDIFDILSKLKNLTSFFVCVKKNFSFSIPFKVNYLKSEYKKTKNGKLVEKDECGISIQPSDLLDLLPSVVIGNGINNLKIKYTNSIYNQKQLFDNLVQILNKLATKNTLDLDFSQVFRSNQAFFDISIIVNEFKFVRLYLLHAKDIISLKCYQPSYQQINKIHIINSDWPSETKLSTLIDIFPNLKRLSYSEGYLKAKDLLKNNKILSKYCNNKTALISLLTKCQFKRLDIYYDLIMEFF